MLRQATNDLVGGVQGREARCDRSDEEMDAEERGSWPRGATGWQKLSGFTPVQDRSVIG
jgi:hypothetical protein